MDDTNNPYRPPDAALVGNEAPIAELASLRARFFGAMADGLIGSLVAFPIYYFSGVWDRILDGTITTQTMIVISILGSLGFLVIHGYTLATRGQTLGKLLVKTQIVAEADASLLPLWKVYLLRYLPISLVGLIRVVGNIAVMVDTLFIYRKDRRCIHDLIAGTKVVQYIG